VNSGKQIIKLEVLSHLSPRQP